MKSLLKTIEFSLEEPTGVDRDRWPVTRGVPFAQGMLRDEGQVVLRDGQGLSLPIQTLPLAHWPDGSIMWLLIDTQVCIKAQSKNRFMLDVYEEPLRREAPPNMLIVSRNERSFAVDTGAIKIHIDWENGLSLFSSITKQGVAVLIPDADRGFMLVDEAGNEFSSRFGNVTKAEIEAFGPLRAVLFFCGDHRNKAGIKLFRYEARLTLFAGKPWVHVEYTFINDSDNEVTHLHQVGFEIVPALQGSATGLVGAYTLLHESSEPFSIYQDKGCRYFFFSGSRIFDAQGQHIEYDHAGEMLKKAAHGWMDVSDNLSGVTVAIKRMAMLAPKAIAFTGSSLDVQLWPKVAGPLEFHQGMGKTHSITIAFHEDMGREQGVNQLATCFEDDLLLTCSEWMVESGVFGNLFPYQPQRYPEINIRLRDQFNSFYMTNFGLGFFDYGDSPQRAAGARADYWANNEYDLPQVMALMFARTGEREYFEVMEASALHMMDIDFIHHTTHAPLELGGVRIHGDNHCQYNCEGMQDYSLATSHMWTEGLLSYYFLTGKKAALERAYSIGSCLLNLLDDGWALPPYKVEWHSVRDSAWTIIALSALYKATNEEKWMSAICKIGEAVLDLQNSDGSWNLFLGWYNGCYAPLQIGIGINGLAYYHSLTSDPRAEAALIKAAEVLGNECTYPEGNLSYINAPGYRWNYYATCIIEGLGYVWNLTKEERYLRIGERSLYKALCSTTGTGTSLAESWRGMLRYMYWADQAGTLRDIRPW